jgi:hypothetical protein
MTTVTTCVALVFTPSPTVATSWYEFLRQSMSSGFAITSWHKELSWNTDPGLPATIIQFWKVVKPSWLISSGSELSTAPMTRR